MSTTVRVLVAAIAALAMVSWLVGRVGERHENRLAPASAIVMRLCLGVALSLLAASAATRSGNAWIEFSLFALGALWFFAIAGVLIWSVATGKLEKAGDD